MATMQMQKPKTGSWSAIFPTEQVTEQQSALFVKKLLAVAISNITYLRTIFPEHAFGNRCLEDLSLKILRDDSACPGACQVIKWVKGCFDALDKKYLRMIILGIYMDTNDPGTVMETYTFKFGYNTESGAGITVFHNGNKITGAYSEAETKKATIKLLRTIVVLTQTLKPLPDDVMMTMKLLYYDHVTPDDYEPPGFQATSDEDFAFKEETTNIKVGDVLTPFHTVKLRIRTSSSQFILAEDHNDKCSAESGAVANDCSVVEQPQLKQEATKMVEGEGGEGGEGESTTVEPMDTEEKRTCTGVAFGRAAEPTVLGQSSSEVQLVTPELYHTATGKESRENSPPPKVRCPCGVHEDDGLMVLCGVCNVWQHAICFGLLQEEDVPEFHVCEQCAQSADDKLQSQDSQSAAGRHKCTDPFLQFLSPVALQSTCLWRRALMACSETTRVMASTFSKRLGVEVSVAQGLINRLEREGFVRAPLKGKRNGKIVEKAKLKNDGIIKYFDKSKLSKQAPPTSKEATPPTTAKSNGKTAVDEITQKASSLNISAGQGRVKGQTQAPPPASSVSAIPGHVISEETNEDAGSVRRSPRLAKRARPLNDESLEFELSCSQDPDASITGGDSNQRKRRKKASIASRSILV